MMDVISMRIFVGNIYQIVKVDRLNKTRRRIYEMIISRQLFYCCLFSLHGIVKPRIWKFPGDSGRLKEIRQKTIYPLDEMQIYFIGTLEISKYESSLKKSLGTSSFHIFLFLLRPIKFC